MQFVNRLDRWISPSVLFLCGVALMPAFLSQRIPALKLLLLALYGGLCITAGRRLRIVGNLFFFAAVVFFNLLNPSGRILLAAGPLTVTDAALKSGVLKALSFIGLTYISAFAIHPRLRLPGRVGYLLSRTFGYFHLLLRNGGFQPKRPLKSLDLILVRLGEPAGGELPTAPMRTTPAGGVLVFGLLAVSWGLAALGWSGALRGGWWLT